MKTKISEVQQLPQATAVIPLVPLATTAMEPARQVEVEGRLRVTKAYKMFIGGAFVRSESGRYFQVASSLAGAARQDPSLDADPPTVNVPRGSRKDVRDAVLAAKSAYDKWRARTPFNRGQILYRLAEVIESRSEELVRSLERSGASPDEAGREVATAVDRAVFYAGFCDKFSSLVASHNPVSGPHFGFSLPEPMGVIALLAPPRPALLGMLSVVLPVIAGGNTVVALASSVDPRTVVLLCECLATSDLPGGVVNVLTGYADEMAPTCAKHREVLGIDAWTDTEGLRSLLEREGADSVKRVKTHAVMDAELWYDDRVGQGIGWIERFLETKTVWHPVGV